LDTIEITKKRIIRLMTGVNLPMETIEGIGSLEDAQ
jgi:hypothetical protein